MIWLRSEHVGGMIYYRMTYKGNDIAIVFPNYMAAALSGQGGEFPSAVHLNGKIVSTHKSFIRNIPGSTYISGMAKHIFKMRERTLCSSVEAQYSIIFRGTPILPKIDVLREGKLIASSEPHT
jgi:hypothetical protein